MKSKKVTSLLSSVTNDDGFMLFEKRKEQIGEESDVTDRELTLAVGVLLSSAQTQLAPCGKFHT